MMHPDGLTGLVGLRALVELGGAGMTGAVSAVDGARVTVTLDDGATVPGDLPAVVVNVFAPDALYRLEGRATVTGGDLVTAGDSTIERIQRRRWPRRPIDLPVTLCPVADGLRIEGIPGRTVDIGIGGCCVETLRPLVGEGNPMVILGLPDGTTVVSGSSTVASEDLGDGWRYRLAFRGLEAHDAGRIAALME